MSTRINSSDCQFCAEVSKASGEDPIGTAGTYDQLLLVETPQPWTRQIWQQYPYLQPLNQLVRNTMRWQGVRIRLMALAPDQDYCQPDRIRVLHLRRPLGPFAQLKKVEFSIPEAQFLPLVRDLLKHPTHLDRWQHYQQASQATRDLLVCTHATHDLACGRFGNPLFRRLRQEYASDTLRIWQTSHFGGHRFAPTLVDLPSGRFWGHLQPDILPTLVHQTGPLQDLYPYYRGWTGLNKFAQIAEREIWMQEGWDWINFPKEGQIIAQDVKGIHKILSDLLQKLPVRRTQILRESLGLQGQWAEVLIQFQDLSSGRSGVYQAQVNVSGTVNTMGESGGDSTLKVNQYTVDLLPQSRILSPHICEKSPTL